jgi:hypothetical protein
MHLFATTTAEQVLQMGKSAPVVEVEKKVEVDQKQPKRVKAAKAPAPGH